MSSGEHHTTVARVREELRDLRTKIEKTKIAISFDIGFAKVATLVARSVQKS
jgi:hypothetical protein